ncbi:MAG: helix-turn-helix transcriptional regulator [Eubacteriales bacterium]|nr:helix-turn-helix transcriptional regulator [Eubacteriales bacterium]
MNRIKDLRIKNGLSQADLGRVLGCISATVSKWELEQRQLDPATINTLCDYFGVSSDYLLCRSDTPNPVISDTDAALLRAYHAASLRDRELIDHILAAYAEEENTGKNAG